MTGRTKSKRNQKVIPETVKSKEVKQPEQEKEATKPAKNAKTASLPEPAKPPAVSPKTVATPETSKATPTPTISEPSRGPQYFKCQRWGHLSFGCKNDTRCVKCARGHRASKCPKKPEDPCRCANCDQSHPASYKGCAAAPKTRRFKSKPKQTQNEGKEKSVISKLANVFLPMLKENIAETSTAAAQTDPDKKIRTNTTWTQTEQHIPQLSDEDNQAFRSVMDFAQGMIGIFMESPEAQVELSRELSKCPNLMRKLGKR